MDLQSREGDEKNRYRSMNGWLRREGVGPARLYAGRMVSDEEVRNGTVG